MTYIGLAQVAVFTALIAGLTKPLGFYMARVSVEAIACNGRAF